MKKHYDFSKAKHESKFYRPIEKLRAPTYANMDVINRELMASMISARKKAGVSQAELASMIGTKQSAISRLEGGAFKKATIETLEKIANALNFKIEITVSTETTITKCPHCGYTKAHKNATIFKKDKELTGKLKNTGIFLPPNTLTESKTSKRSYAKSKER